MLNWIWGIMIVSGTAYGIVMGNTQAIGEGIMEGAAEGVSLAITMAGVLGLWCGLMEIAEKSGLLKTITKLLMPFVHFLFPKIPKGHQALDYISVNFVANMFGLAGAATPPGLKAMECLQDLEKEREQSEQKKKNLKKKGNEKIASREMCTFLILNVSSLQLLPINMVAYRSQYGSVNATAIVGPAMIATLFSTMAAVIFCKIMGRK